MNHTLATYLIFVGLLMQFCETARAESQLFRQMKDRFASSSPLLVESASNYAGAGTFPGHCASETDDEIASSTLTLQKNSIELIGPTLRLVDSFTDASLELENHPSMSWPWFYWYGHGSELAGTHSLYRVRLRMLTSPQGWYWVAVYEGRGTIQGGIEGRMADEICWYGWRAASSK
jgi:hypothetical protein